MSFVPKKLYYKIGEVCEIVGVEPYVLRYWESEFASLTPPKNRAGQRTYRPKDIELLLQIRKLLYEEGFTIAGARKQLGTAVPVRNRRANSRISGKDAARLSPPPQQSHEPRAQRLNEVRAELENILTLLERE